MSSFLGSLLPGGDRSWDCLIRSADGSVFRANLSILCMASGFFRAAADYGDSKELLLNGVPGTALGVLLRYYCAGEVLIDKDNVTEVLSAADMLLMDEARDFCLDLLLSYMDVDNCLAALAQGHHWPRFKETVFTFALEHFETVWRSSSEFPEATAPLLAELFSSSEVSVREEVNLLYAIRLWYKRSRASAAERAAGLPLLLQCARVGLCTETGLVMFREQNPTLAKTSAFRLAVPRDQRRGPGKCSPSPLLLLHCYGFGIEECRAQASLESQHDDQRRAPQSAITALSRFPCVRCAGANPERWLPRVPHEMLFIAGGSGSGQFRDIEVYDARANRWLLHTTQTMSPRAFHGVAAVGKFVYVVGNVLGAAYLRSCKRFDTERCVWEHCADMSTHRGLVAVAVLKSYIYAVGGCNDNGCTATVERYNTASNQWARVSSMNRALMDASACAFKGQLYASGGFDGRMILNSVEVYTPSTDSWFKVQPCMPSPRCGHRMMDMAGRIYIVGGHDGSGRLNTMIATGMDGTRSSWQHMAPMRMSRSSFAVAQLFGELYVIGGMHGAHL